MSTPDILDRIRVLNTEIEEDIKHGQNCQMETTTRRHHIQHNLFQTLEALIRGLNNRYTDKMDTHETVLTHGQTNIPTDTQQTNILNTHQHLQTTTQI